RNRARSFGTSRRSEHLERHLRCAVAGHVPGVCSGRSSSGAGVRGRDFPPQPTGDSGAMDLNWEYRYSGVSRITLSYSSGKWMIYDQQ
ncbi:MAG TPA: hypothetical protein PK717_06260, partial [Caldisericia bacterium]|nr:hypothetical protein [Caldisericia bacterium]